MLDRIKQHINHAHQAHYIYPLLCTWVHLNISTHVSDHSAFLFSLSQWAAFELETLKVKEKKSLQLIAVKVVEKGR